MALDSMPPPWLPDANSADDLDAAEIEALIVAAEGYLQQLRKLRDTACGATASTSHDRGPKLRPWQEEALEDWRRQKYRGVVQAVTGAGKTWVGIAAIEAAERVGLRAVVVVPKRVLVAQWVTNLNKVLPGFMVSTQIADKRPWQVMVTTVQAAMNSPVLKRSEHGLLVADECHRYGAERFSQALRPEYERRLGLTATLKRDDRGDRILESYFKGICHDLGYRRALDEELISPYRFAYASVPLNARERREYDDIEESLTSARRALVSDWDIPEKPFGEFYAAVSRLADGGDRQAKFYLFNFSRRQAVLAGTKMKLMALAALAPAVRTSSGTIVFTKTQDASQSAAETLQATGCSAAAIHSALDEGEREQRLDLFRRHETTAISAPRILDEGVDVPEADLGIIMAASRGRRQTIQRLGRVLRRRPGKVARFVVMYAEGTVEDPFNGQELPDFYEECIPHADEFDKFDVAKGEMPSLLEFLGAAEDRASEVVQHDIHRAAVGAQETVILTSTEDELKEAEEEEHEDLDDADEGLDSTLPPRSYAPISPSHLRRLYDFASSAHQHLATKRYSLKGGILAACLCGDAAAHYVDKTTGLEVLDVVLLYRANASKKPLPSGTLFSYDFGISDLGRNPEEDPATFTGRRINISAQMLKVGDADPDDAVRAWLKDEARTQLRGPDRRAVLVWPRQYIGRVVGSR